MPASLQLVLGQVFPAGALQSQPLTHCSSPQVWLPLLRSFCTMSWAFCSPTRLHCLVQPCCGVPQISPLGDLGVAIWCCSLHDTRVIPCHSRSPRRGSTKSCPCEWTATHGAAVQMMSSLGKASSPSSRFSLGAGFSSPLFVKGTPADTHQIDVK